MFQPTVSSLAAALFLVAGAAPHASAAVLFFTDQTSYNTAVTAAGLSTSSFNFNSTPVQSYGNAAGITIDGVNFVSPTGNGGYYLGTAPPNFCCNDYTNPNESLQAAAITSAFYNIPNGSTNITFATPTRAFSLIAFTVQAGDYTNSGHDILNLNVGGSIGHTATTTGSGTGFIGFLSTTNVSSAILTGTTNEDFIDIIGGTVAGPGVSSTPEPSAWAMMILACAAGACFRFRRACRSDLA